VPEAAVAAPPPEPSPLTTDPNLNLSLNFSLDLNLIVAPPWVEPGDVVTFTVALTNTGSVALPELTVENPLPAGLLYVSGSAVGFTYSPSAKTLTWAVGELAAGQGVSGGFRARVQGLAIGATVTNTVTTQSPALATPLTAQAVVNVVPPTADEAWITPAQGGILRSTDGRVLLRVPPGAVRGPVQLHYRSRPTFGGLLATFALEGASAGGFGQPAELRVRPPAMIADAAQLAQLRLLAWDEQAGAWRTLPHTADPATETLRALVHAEGVYVLASGGPTYGVTLLPSLKVFTSELWSGAAVVSYDLDVPAGPGGLGLNLRLVYNSQGSNILEQVAGSQYRAQASWVGLGWDLAGIGSISRPLGKTGPYVLSFGGGAFEIKDVGGVLTTDPQGFLKIEHSGGLAWNTQPWVVRTPGGMKYTRVTSMPWPTKAARSTATSRTFASIRAPLRPHPTARPSDGTTRAIVPAPISSTG